MLEPGQLPQFAVPRLGESDGVDRPGFKTEQRPPAFVELHRAGDPAAPALLAVELVSQPFEVAGGQQVGPQQVAPQLGPLGRGGEHLGADQLGTAHQPVGQQHLQIQHRLGFIGAQQPPLHQQRTGLQEGGEHGPGIGEFRIHHVKIGRSHQGVGHGAEFPLVRQLHVGAGHPAQGLPPQLRLELIPGQDQRVAPDLLVLEPPAQQFELFQQGQQQIAATVGMKTIEGQQLATAIVGPQAGRLAETLPQGLPDAVGGALAQGEAHPSLAGRRFAVEHRLAHAGAALGTWGAAKLEPGCSS